MKVAVHSSESAEHYSPPAVVALAYRVLGDVDLDPASCEAANSYIEASRYFDARDDGLHRDWYGRVFLNPPGGLVDRDGRPVYPKTKSRAGCSTTGACGLAPGHVHKGVTSSAKAWWFKFMREVFAGRVSGGLFVGFSTELLRTAQGGAPEADWVSGAPLPSPLDFPLLVPRKRLRFLSPRGGKLAVGRAPTLPNFLSYVGPSGPGLAAFEAEDSPDGLGKVVVPRALCPRKLRPSLCTEARGWCRREHAPTVDRGDET